MTQQYRGPEWVEPIENDLDIYIKEGRKLQAQAMRKGFSDLSRAISNTLRPLRGGSGAAGSVRRRTFVHPTLL